MTQHWCLRLVSGVGQTWSQAISCREGSKPVLDSTSSEMAEPAPQSGRTSVWVPRLTSAFLGDFLGFDSSSDQAPFKLLLLL